MTVIRQPYQQRPGGIGAIASFPDVVKTPFWKSIGLGPQSSRGGGGAICGGYFIGVTFNAHNFAPSEGVDRNLPTLVNYAIFKNYM